MTAWEALIDGGIMVLVINQKNRAEHYIEWMLDYVNDFAQYLGIISYAKPGDYFKSPQPMFIWKKEKVVVLKTARLSLRKFQMSDRKDFVALQSRSENMQNLGSGKIKSPEASTKQLQRYIEQYSVETYARFYPILLDNTMVGYIGYYSSNEFGHPMLKDRYALRIMIDKKHRGKGYASEIVHKFLKKYSYKRIQMMVEVSNKKSNKLFTKYSHKVMMYKGKKYNLYDSVATPKNTQFKSYHRGRRRY